MRRPTAAEGFIELDAGGGTVTTGDDLLLLQTQQSALVLEEYEEINLSRLNCIRDKVTAFLAALIASAGIVSRSL